MVGESILIVDDEPSIVALGEMYLTREGFQVESVGDGFSAIDTARKVKSSQKSQKDYVANISHDLKTPMTSIQGFAQALLVGTIESDEKINEAAKIAKEIIYAHNGKIEV